MESLKQEIFEVTNYQTVPPPGGPEMYSIAGAIVRSKKTTW